MKAELTYFLLPPKQNIAHLLSAKFRKSAITPLQLLRSGFIQDFLHFNELSGLGSDFTNYTKRVT
jgi:hypothetical protein